MASSLFDLPEEKQAPIPAAAPDQDLLKQIAEQAQTLTALDVKMGELDEAMKALKAERTHVATQIIPGLMEEAGQRGGLKLATGDTLDIVDVVQASLPSAAKDMEARDKALDWLIENGHDQIIKGEVKITMGRDQHEFLLALEQFMAGSMSKEEAVGLAEDIKSFVGKVSVREDVHNQTLKAWVREMLAENQGDFPRDLFGVYEYSEAKIKKGKQ